MNAFEWLAFANRAKSFVVHLVTREFAMRFHRTLSAMGANKAVICHILAYGRRETDNY